jgi:hypothetical protein
MKFSFVFNIAGLIHWLYLISCCCWGLLICVEYLNKGSIIMYDNRVLWSDLAATVTHTLTEYVLLQDMLKVRSQANQLLQTFSAG